MVLGVKEKIMNTTLLDGIRKQAMIKFANIEKLKKKHGITQTEKAEPGHSVHSIGFSPKEQKFWGWSHRAAYGFGIGDKMKMGDAGFQPFNKEEFLEQCKSFWETKTHDFEVLSNGVKVTTKKNKSSFIDRYPQKWGRGAWTAKTLDDAKEMAKDFAESVS